MTGLLRGFLFTLLINALPADGWGRAPVSEVDADSANAMPSRTILVMNLRPTGVSEVEAVTLTNAIAEQLAQHSFLRVVTADEVDDMVKHQKALRLMGCHDEQCIAEISRVANAELVLTGSLGKIGSGYILTLSLIDSRTTSVVSSAEIPAPSMDQIQAQLGDAVSSLLGPGTDEAPRYRLPEGREVSFAVLDLKGQGVSDAVSQNLTQVLATAIKKVEGTSVISRDDIAAMLELEAEKVAMDCADEASCLAEIGGALGVEKLVVGQVGLLGDRYLISLRLIDVRMSAAQNRVSETFIGVEDQLMAAVRSAGRALLGLSSSEPGGLAITATATDADLFLDDELKGQLPMRPLSELSPGRYVLHVNKVGFYEWRSQVYVEPGVTNMIWVEMEEKPPKIAFWTFFAATLATGAATIVCAGLTEYYRGIWQAEREAQLDGDPAARASARNSGLALATSANVLLVATGILAASTGIAAIFTDWE